MKKTGVMASTAVAVAIAGGLGLANAGVAHAGTSVAPHTNGATGVHWAFYASTNKLCIKRPFIGNGGVIRTGDGKSVSAYVAKRGHWECRDLTDGGHYHEGSRVTIYLYGHGTMSKGYVRL